MGEETRRQGVRPDLHANTDQFVSRARNAVKRGLGSWLAQGVKTLSYYARLYPIVQHPGAIPPAILFYHKVQRCPVSIWGEPVLDARRFEHHITLLKREYQPIPLSMLVDGLLGKVRLPERAVALTFDDGYRNNLTVAAPLLRQHGIPATFFVTTGLVGTDRWMWAYELEHMFHRYPVKQLRECARHPAFARLCSRELAPRIIAMACVEYLKSLPHAELLEVMGRLRERLPVELDEENRFLTWDEVRRLRDDGFEIGAHTETHPLLPRLSLEEVERELLRCRDTLEWELGARPRFFAYPNGNTTPEISARVGRYFEAALTTRPSVCTPSSSLLELPRIGAPVSPCELAYQLTRQHLEGPPCLLPLGVPE